MGREKKTVGQKRQLLEDNCWRKGKCFSKKEWNRKSSKRAFNSFIQQLLTLNMIDCLLIHQWLLRIYMIENRNWNTPCPLPWYTPIRATRSHWSNSILCLHDCYIWEQSNTSNRKQDIYKSDVAKIGQLFILFNTSCVSTYDNDEHKH